MLNYSESTLQYVDFTSEWYKEQQQETNDKMWQSRKYIQVDIYGRCEDLKYPETGQRTTEYMSETEMSQSNLQYVKQNCQY